MERIFVRSCHRGKFREVVYMKQNKEIKYIELEDNSIIKCTIVKKFGKVAEYKPEYLEALKRGEDVELPVSCAETPTRFHNRENAIKYSRKTKQGNVVFLSPTELEKKTENWLAD